MPLLKKFNDPGVLIEESCEVLGIALSHAHARMILQHLVMLVQWRARINLTSLRDPMEIALLHVVDSLTVFKVISIGYGLRVLDVGTGAGFPGLVMKIVDPSLKMTLLDRDPKKIVFLKYVARELGLTDIIFSQTTIADFLKRRPSPVFNIVVSRAFSSSPVILNSFSLLLGPESSLIRMAGPASRFPMDLPDFRIDQVWEGFLPFSNNFRRVYRYTVVRGFRNG